MSIMDGLNPQQAEAVSHRNGPAVVVAGPGAGKTKVLVTRTASLLREGVVPERILLLTFTRAAANTMITKARAADERAQFVTAGTFHSWGIRIVNANHHVFGLEKPFTLLDQEDVAELVKRAMEPLKGERNWPRASTVAKILSYATNTQKSIAEAVQAKAPDHIELAEEIEKVRDRLVEMKIERGLIDYDDVLVYLGMLLEDPDIGAQIRSQYDQVMVDEYQDTNMLQLVIVHSLVGENGNVMIVGDACQPGSAMISKVNRSGKAGGGKLADREITEVPISSLKVGDKIVGYGVADSTFFLNRKVEGISSMPYDGNLIKVEMEDGRSSEYTSNHRCLVSYKSLRDRYVVYLMRKGDIFRLGKSKMSYGNTGKNSGCGAVHRAKTEQADALWILETYENQEDAAVAEIESQIRYGIPSLTFVSTPCPRGRILSQDMIDHCWNKLSDINFMERAEKCLAEFGREIEYPIWERGNPHFRSKRPDIVRACNILDGALMLPFDRVTQTHITRAQWKPVKVMRRHFIGDVYSLTVSHNHIYIADGIATHNSQSIYGFRGGAPATMRRFRDSFAGTRTIALETNYRSTPEIVELVNAIDKRMDNGFERTLRAARPGGAKPRIVDVADGAAEAGAIADAILLDKAEGGEVCDHAILVRSTAAARRIEAEFLTRAIPFKVTGGVRIDEAAHIRDLLSIARLATNFGHEPAWMRMLPRFRKVGAKAAEAIISRVMTSLTLDEATSVLREEGVSRKTELATLAQAIEAVADNPEVAEGLSAAIDIMRPIWASTWDEDWSSREKDLEAVLLIAEEHPTVESFLTTITLDGSMDKERAGAADKPEESPVSISTIHSAKGLEWKHVHVPAFVQGGMPSLFASGEDDMEEELRVFYVAASRAEKTLTFYRPRFNGQGNFTSASVYEPIIRKHVDQDTQPRRLAPSSAVRVETTKTIDLKSRMLGRS